MAANKATPASSEDCAVKGILHGTVERAEASFCESAANESASVLIQS